jgi:hypothetical protein
LRDTARIQILAEAALIVLGERAALDLVALVQEGETEGKAHVAPEDARILGPGDHRARRHDGRDVTGDEARARQLGQGHHGGNGLATLLGVVVRRLGGDDVHFLLVRQVVQRRHDRPAVHLALVDLLRAVIEARRVAEADRVGGREQAERRMRADDLVLVEQGQLAVDLQHALDHEHHVGAAGVVFVEHQGRRVLQRPGQDAFAELGHLLAIAQHDRVLADQVDTAEMWLSRLTRTHGQFRRAATCSMCVDLPVP